MQLTIFSSLSMIAKIRIKIIEVDLVIVYLNVGHQYAALTKKQ